MPTLILVDSSLSMMSPLGEEEGTSLSRKDLAVKGITQFIHLLQETNKHEYVSLATFSDNVKVLQPFTKDFPSLVMSCNTIELESKTVLSSALRYAGDECSTTWSSGSFCQIVIVTDGLGLDVETEDADILPFNFHSFIHLFCLRREWDCDPGLSDDLLSLIRKNGQTEGLHFLDDLSLGGVKRVFSELVEREYAPTFTVLRCGSFSTPVQVSPPCREVRTQKDFRRKEWRLGNTLEILGFLKPAELSYPPVYSRHLVLPLSNPGEKEETQNSVFKEGEKVPNLCVLLHGSMIVSQMAAVCELTQKWYGVLYLLPESKKSNLILNVLHPGTDNVSWLGNLSQLSVRPFLAVSETRSSFPVLQKQKPSYSVATPGWMDASSVQSDIQKLLRQARKIPDRQHQFYLELNRICRYSQALGFPSVVKKVANLLEREASSSSNPQMRKQLNHVALTLRTKPLRYDETIKPAK